jgi:hypothetical protein
LAVEFKHRFLFHPLSVILAAGAYNAPEDFGVEPVAFGLSVDLADVRSRGGLLFLKALDTLDEALQLPGSYGVGALVILAPERSAIAAFAGWAAHEIVFVDRIFLCHDDLNGV